MARKQSQSSAAKREVAPESSPEAMVPSEAKANEEPPPDERKVVDLTVRELLQLLGRSVP